ncbi:endolytic transglycosylase MltG [Aestuariicella hydrocarbonica]|uniref:Endolytic murein transglycosylase n=1 Tax=Pseudomaricurvus hydrocarbonicus TaxID=1470433 RepID=A0A9E5MKD6_9GAMM|nr:endolytic transglycosylase MltG [Aestuariicella hydrocarbonica]NHO65242.1 endolytic transglycosylase MltG [Aestuariicella hydrocarbonica]
MIRKVFLSQWFRLLLACVLAITLSAGLYLWKWLHTPTEVPAEYRTYELKAGDSLHRVIYHFYRQQSFTFPRILILYAKLTETTNVKLGEYELPDQISPVELLHLFHAGKVKQRTLTLVEGITFADAVREISGQQHIQTVLADHSADTLKTRLGIDHTTPEGWLFPDTYVYSKHTSDWDLIQQAYRRMRDVLEAEWQDRASDLPYKNAYEALIMASIVEKETGAPHERAEIAGVFVRRLQRGMRLQTDPTVIYGMGDQYQGKIRRKNLREPTPYNTYMINGLPPTPIALPGREAIHAALHPAEGKTLFFVAKGDGTHQFSVTLAEHEAAVKKYQLQRSSNYRSTLQ